MSADRYPNSFRDSVTRYTERQSQTHDGIVYHHVLARLPWRNAIVTRRAQDMSYNGSLLRLVCTGVDMIPSTYLHGAVELIPGRVTGGGPAVLTHARWFPPKIFSRPVT